MTKTRSVTFTVRIFAPGVGCDPCVSSDECSSGMCIWMEPFEEAFCLEACEGAEDCAGGFTCQTVGGGVTSVCVPNTGTCGESGQMGQTGEYCYGAATCESGRCLATPRGATCTELCELGGDRTCPSEMECLPVRSEHCPPEQPECGLCLHAGDEPLGGLCWDGQDCISGQCLGQVGEPGRCSAPCNEDSDCDTGGVCSLGVCALPGTWPDGARCQSPFDCAGGVCTPLPSSGRERPPVRAPARARKIVCSIQPAPRSLPEIHVQGHGLGSGVCDAEGRGVCAYRKQRPADGDVLQNGETGVRSVRIPFPIK